MVLMCLSPLSGSATASLPHVLVLSCLPPVPNPILESQFPQLFSLFPRIPIRALAYSELSLIVLKPSLLQRRCNELWEPSNVFQVLRPSDVARNCPSAISEYSESATLFMAIKLKICSPGIFSPRQILEKGMPQ